MPSLSTNGRGARGMFAPGNTIAKGRKAPLDFRRLIETRAAAEGVDLEDAVWDVALALLEAAKGGDVKAAALFLDRVCGPLRIEAELKLLEQTSAVVWTEGDRREFAKLAGDPAAQEAMLDECERRCEQADKISLTGAALTTWMNRLSAIQAEDAEPT